MASSLKNRLRVQKLSYYTEDYCIKVDVANDFNSVVGCAAGATDGVVLWGITWVRFCNSVERTGAGLDRLFILCCHLNLLIIQINYRMLTHC